MFKIIFSSVSLLVLISNIGNAYAQACETDNAALRAMPAGLVEVTRTDGSQLEFEVKVANKGRTRSAGFQRVCAETIAKTPILFVFSSPFTPRFHMNNVVAPIDIAFIRKNGSVDSIQAMQTYVMVSKDKPLYSPTSAVIAALEGHPGFFEDNEIDTTAQISWSLVKQNSQRK